MSTGQRPKVRPLPMGLAMVIALGAIGLGLVALRRSRLAAPTSSADSQMGADRDITINGISADNLPGFTVATGDVNDDWAEDVVIAHTAGPVGKGSVGQALLLLGPLGETQLETIPSSPTTSDDILIRLSGLWSDSCVPQDPAVSISASTVAIDTFNPGEACLTVLTNWDLTVPIGRLSAGTYELIVTHRAGPSGVPTELARQNMVVVNPIALCTLDLNLTYAAGILGMNFDVGTLEPATGNAWLFTENTTAPLGSIQLPITDPPTTPSFSIPVARQGKVGVLSTQTTQSDGITCSTWVTIDTGFPPAPEPTPPPPTPTPSPGLCLYPWVEAQPTTVNIGEPVTYSVYLLNCSSSGALKDVRRVVLLLDTGFNYASWTADCCFPGVPTSTTTSLFDGWPPGTSKEPGTEGRCTGVDTPVPGCKANDNSLYLAWPDGSSAFSGAEAVKLAAGETKVLTFQATPANSGEFVVDVSVCFFAATSSGCDSEISTDPFKGEAPVLVR